MDKSDEWDAMNDGPYKWSGHSGKGKFIIGDGRDNANEQIIVDI